MELQKAVQKGYLILEIYEVYHFEHRSVYNKETKKGGIFTDYVNTFLKLKTESSGWPDWVNTEEDKDKYISSYYEHEGILLDRNKIKHNPALRSVAKLAINSLWGKLAQNPHHTKTSIVNDGVDFFKLMFDPKCNIKDFHILSDKYAQIDWEINEDSIPMSENTNIYLASFTTSHARLHLYSLIEKLD